MSGFQGYDQWKTASPYDDEIEDNDAVEKAFSDYASPYDLYRSVYKYTPCGPTVGFTFYAEWGPGDNGEAGPASTYEPPCNRTFYGDDLRQLGDWANIAENGALITEICVSSIVEGVEQCTDTEYVDCDGFTFEPKEISDYFWKAVESVDKQANEIWNDTHGCENCAKMYGNLNPTYSYIECEGCDGMTPVHPNCPDCRGQGTII